MREYAKNEIVIDPRKTAETSLGQPLWKNGDFEETADDKPRCPLDPAETG